MKYEKVKLKDICSYVAERIETEKVDEENYISTENMVSNKGGKVRASKLPNSKSVIAYKPGDVLISNIRPYFKKIWFSSNIGGSSADVLVIRPNEKVIPDYLYYFLSQDKIFDYMVQTSKGTKMPRGDKQALMDYELAIPNLDIQKNISKFFSNIDKKIEINNSLISNLEELAQTLFKRWFVDFEFPNEEGKPYKSSGGKMVESELGMIPEGWEIKQLGEVYNIKYGKNLPTNQMIDSGYYVFGANGIIGYHDEFMYEDSQVIITCRGSGSGDVLKSRPYSFITNNSLIIEDEEKLGSIFTSNVIKVNSPYNFVTGSAQPQITVKNISKMKIILPNKDHLKEFKDFSEGLEAKLESSYKENESLISLRDTLLPKLLSGEIELPDDMEVAEDVPIS